MRKLLCFTFLFLSAFAYGQTVTVSGHTITGQNGTSSSGISILWELTNDNGQQCKVAGTGLLTPMSFSVTQAQLAAGISMFPNSGITCGTTLGASRWRYTIKANGVGTRQCSLNITGTTNLDSTACLNATSTPVTVTPTDSLYCRIDGTNCGFTGPITGTSATYTGNVSVGGTQTNGGNVSIKGPNPWADVTQYSLPGDSSPLDTPWTTFMTTASNPANNIHTIYFPITSVGKYQWNAQPTAIGIEAVLKCGDQPVQWNPTGVDAAQLLANYDEATASNGFHTWSGSSAPGNSGVIGCQFWKGTGHTGGTAIKFSGASTSVRAGGGPIWNNRVSGDGTFAWGFRADGSLITTPGSQGLRDIHLLNNNFFQTTSGCMFLNNVVHFYWTDGGCFLTGGSPNADVTVTGATGANSSSTNVSFANLHLLGATNLDWVKDFTGMGVYTNSLTATVNTKESIFVGISATLPTISGQLAYLIFDPTSPAGFGSWLTDSLRASRYIGAGTVPAGAVAGDVFAARSTTTGLYWYGATDFCFTSSLGSWVCNSTATNPSFALGGSTTGHCSIQDNPATVPFWNFRLGDKTGECFIQSGNTIRLTADFTTANNTSLQTIFSWTTPTVTTNWNFHCNLIYSQATAAVADAFGIQAATNNPTNIEADGIVYTAAAVSTSGVLATLATTTATNIVTFTPGATATNNVALLHGQLELTGVANTINIMVSTSAGADAITIKRGSSCSITP